MDWKTHELRSVTRLALQRYELPPLPSTKFNGLMNRYAHSLFEILDAEEATGTGEATGQAEEAKGTEKVT